MKILSLMAAVKAAETAGPLNLQNLCSLMVLLLLLLLLSFTAAGTAHFLQMTFTKGMIFRKYKALLTYWFWFKPRERRGFKWSRQYITQNTSEYIKRSLQIRPARWYSWFYKPLGGCVYCNGVWLATALYIPFWVELVPTVLTALFLWVLYIGANYVFIELIQYLKSKNSEK